MPFSDDDLDTYYREIEARTATDRDLRRSGTPTTARPSPDVSDCPTPDKGSYRSAADAQDTINHIRGLRPQAPMLSGYRCVCGAWHITSRARPFAVHDTASRRRGVR